MRARSILTWAKHGSEYQPQLAKAGLSDAARCTHTEVIDWLYQTESDDCRVPKGQVRRIAISDHWESAVCELLAAGFWADKGTDYEILHHASVIRQSLAEQRQSRTRNRRNQRAKRARDKALDANVTDDVSADVSAAVSGNTVSQTDSQYVAEVPEQRNGHAFTEPETGWRLMARGYDN